MNSYIKELRNNSFSNNPYVQAAMSFFKIAVLDKDGIILWVNAEYCELMQYPLNELQGKSIYSLIIGGSLPVFSDSEELKRGEPWMGELKNRARDGSVVWFRTKIIRVNDERANEDRYIATKTNITKTIAAIKDAADQKINYNSTLEELAFMTSHRVRGPLTRAMGLIELLKMKAINSEEWVEVINHFTHCIDELDGCTRELADFIYEYQSNDERDRIKYLYIHPEPKFINELINEQTV